MSAGALGAQEDGSPLHRNERENKVEEENKQFTEAQMQIDRLRELKKDKELKVKKMKSEAFKYVDQKKEIRAKRPPRMIKIEKALFDKVHKAVTVMNKADRKNRITKDKFVNMILNEILGGRQGVASIKTKEDFKKLLKKIKPDK